MQNRSRPHVLLVEDDPDHRLIAEHYLKKVADRIERLSHASDLKTTVEALQKDAPDIVLLDLTLPDSDLDATLGSLAELTRDPSIQFVALSSLGTSDIAQRAQDGGAAAFLPKQSINAASLHALLDELGIDAASAAPATVEAKASVAPTADESDHAVDRTLDSAKLASKIAHNALGWASNLSFRATAMAADPLVQESDSLQAGLASVQSSAAALSSYITGTRSLLLVELAARGIDEKPLEEVALGGAVDDAIERWRKMTRDERIDATVDIASSASLPEGTAVRLLGQAITAMLENASRHAARSEGTIEVIFREVPCDGPRVRLEVLDDGGPWHFERPIELGAPLATGRKKATGAGLGLFIAGRALELLGGSMRFRERDDVPGAYAVDLELPRA